MGCELKVGDKAYQSTDFYITGPLKMRGKSWYGWCFYGESISVERGNIFNSREAAIADANSHGVLKEQRNG